MDVVDAGAADDGAAAGRCLDPRKSEEDRGRGGRRPHHARGRRRTDRGDVKVSEKLRILVTGFGPFPGAPFNPTQPLVARLVRLRRPALGDVELSGHIFPVTYTAVDRELPELLASRQPHALLMFGLASRTPYVRVETRARNAVTTLWPDADHARLRKGSIAGGADALMFGPHVAKLLRAADGTGIDARTSHVAGREGTSFERTSFEQWLSVSGTIETIDAGGLSAAAARGCIRCPGSSQVTRHGMAVPVRPSQAMSTDE